MSLAERRKRNAGKVAAVVPGMREGYKLDPSFLQACTAYAAGVAGRKFFALVGHAMEPDLLGDPRAKTVFELARAVKAESGNPPGSVVTTLQRLARLLDDGKVTVEHHDACVEYVADAADLPDVDELAEQAVLAVLPRVVGDELAPAAIGAIATGDVRAVKKHLEKIERLRAKQSVALVGDDWEAADEADARVGALPVFATGLPIDGALRGGIKQGLVVKVIAGTGVGKSPTLVHFGAEALVRGMFVIHVSLQDLGAYVRARYKANILDMDVDEVLKQTAETTRLLREVWPHLGRLRVREMPADHTTPRDVFDAVDAEEQHAGRRVDALVVDYSGRMKAPGTIDRDGRSHTGIAAVGVLLEEYAKGSHEGFGHPGGPIWVFDAAQRQRRSTSTASQKPDAVKGRPTGTDDVAGGMAEVRDAGFVLTVDRAQEDAAADETLVLHVAKNKLGPHGASEEVVPKLGHARIQAWLPHRDALRLAQRAG